MKTYNWIPPVQFFRTREENSLRIRMHPDPVLGRWWREYRISAGQGGGGGEGFLNPSRLLYSSNRPPLLAPGGGGFRGPYRLLYSLNPAEGDISFRRRLAWGWWCIVQCWWALPPARGGGGRRRRRSTATARHSCRAAPVHKAEEH